MENLGLLNRLTDGEQKQLRKLKPRKLTRAEIKRRKLFARVRKACKQLEEEEKGNGFGSYEAEQIVCNNLGIADKLGYVELKDIAQ